MGRRWIGIEMGEHDVTHCLPRLQKVVAGEQGGISQAVNWQGSGGFRVLQLGAPLFDAGGNVLTSDVLAALHRNCWHAGPKVIYGEACRLGAARLAAEGITFKQPPHAVPR